MGRGLSKFVKFPRMWQVCLAEIPGANACTYRVALYLLDRASFSRRVVVSTKAMQKHGVGRKGKQRALKQFERKGLISVEWHPHKSPMATVRFIN
jgi:hypothetical protein